MWKINGYSFFQKNADGYVPRLFEHVYTGTRADRKKALEASDIGCLVRESR